MLLYYSNNVRIYVGNASVDTGELLSSDQWHHIAFTWNGVHGRYDLYKDGDLASTGTISAGHSFVSGGTLVFAEDQDSVGGGFDPTQAYIGKIDDVRIWNVIRTQNQIQDNMMHELHGNEPGLVGYWKLDEAQGLITYDATSNNKTGTLSGAPSWFVSPCMGFDADVIAAASGDQDTTLTLTGADADWDPLTAFITEIPDSQYGELYQLAAPGPVRGSKISAVDTQVTDPEMRLVFAPATHPDAYTALLRWKVNDALVDSDNPTSFTILVNLDKDILDHILGRKTLPLARFDLVDFNGDGVLDVADLVQYALFR